MSVPFTRLACGFPASWWRRSVNDTFPGNFRVTRREFIGNVVPNQWFRRLETVVRDAPARDWARYGTIFSEMLSKPTAPPPAFLNDTRVEPVVATKVTARGV